MKSKLGAKLLVLALLSGGMAVSPGAAMANCVTETYTEYYSDPARTIWVGERIDTCDGQVLMSGVVGPYHTKITEFCNC